MYINIFNGCFLSCPSKNTLCFVAACAYLPRSVPNSLLQCPHRNFRTTGNMACIIYLNFNEERLFYQMCPLLHTLNFRQRETTKMRLGRIALVRAARYARFRATTTTLQRYGHSSSLQCYQCY